MRRLGMVILATVALEGAAVAVALGDLTLGIVMMVGVAVLWFGCIWYLALVRDEEFERRYRQMRGE